MNTAFDNLKEKNESNETIGLASKGDNVYNFSSDSKDEDFKKKNIEIKKGISVEPKAKRQNTRRGKGSDTYEDTNKTKPVRRKIVAKRTTKQIALEKVADVDLIKMRDLVDEKMREAVKENSNTSFLVEPPTNLEHVELESILHQAPQMEHVQESESNDTVVTKKRTKTTERKNNIESNDILLDEICFVDYDKEVAETDKKQNTKALKPNKKVAKKKIYPTIDTTIEKIETREVIEILESNSDISIATEGITAHGDEDEVPPATESIEEIFQPREFQDLRQEFKDYFTKLTREIYDSSKGSVKSNKSTKGTSKVDNTSARSPVVSVKWLSLEDISKRMPSRRTSDTDTPPASSKIKSARKICETPSGAESSVENTPRVKGRYFGLSKPVKSRRDTYKPVKIVGPKSPAADLVKQKLPSLAISRMGYSCETPRYAESSFENTLRVKGRYFGISKPVKSRRDTYKPVKIVGPKSPAADLVKQKLPSLAISRISLEEFNKLIDSDTEQTKPKESKNTIISRETLKPETPEPRKRKCKSPILSVSKKKRVESQTSFEEIKASEKPKKCIIEPKRQFHQTPVTATSHRTIKQLQVLEDVTLARSGPSSSSMNDWFDITEPVVIDPKLSLKDTIQNVMERLDTTLVEINHNTSKKFVNLFVEAQIELDVLSKQVSKSLALVESFTEKFKTQALELMHDDCQQKRAMVELLKDDVQAVLNHMDKEED